MKMTRAQSGKLGGLALASSTIKKHAAARKAAVTLAIKRPGFYSELGRLSAQRRKERALATISN